MSNGRQSPKVDASVEGWALTALEKADMSDQQGLLEAIGLSDVCTTLAWHSTLRVSADSLYPSHVR